VDDEKKKTAECRTSKDRQSNDSNNRKTEEKVDAEGDVPGAHSSRCERGSCIPERNWEENRRKKKKVEHQGGKDRKFSGGKRETIRGLREVKKNRSSGGKESETRQTAKIET